MAKRKNEVEPDDSMGVAQDKKGEEEEASPKNAKSKGSQAKKKGLKGWQIALLVLLALVIIATLLFAVYGSLPGSLLSAVLAGAPLTGHTIQNIILAKLAGTPQLGAAYVGSVTLNGHDPNLTVTYIKYNSVTRISYAINNISFIGNGVITIINSTADANQDEICIPTSLALFKDNQPPNSATYYCANQSSASYEAIVNKVNGIFNISGATNVYVKSYGISLYNWQPCYKVTGAGDMSLNRELIGQSGMVPAAITFNACISAQYDIPVSMSGTIIFQDASGSNDTMAFNLSQTSTNTSTTSGEVTQLPT